LRQPSNRRASRFVRSAGALARLAIKRVDAIGIEDKTGPSDTSGPKSWRIGCPTGRWYDILAGDIVVRAGRHEPGCDGASGLMHSQRLRGRPRGCAMQAPWQGMQRAGVTMLLLTGLAAPAQAAAASDPAMRTSGTVMPTDKLSLIPASTDTWSVSHTDAGCYLLSPRRRSGTGLAIGWRSNQEFGLFIVNFALAVPAANAGERVLIQAGRDELNGSGRMIGFGLFFVPLKNTEMAEMLRQLENTGTLWLKVRDTWIAHGGQGLPAALATYSQTCAAGAVTSR
jgi:hypothetical protein